MNCEWTEDQTEDSDVEGDIMPEESEPANDESNMMFPLIIMTTEDIPKMKEKHLKDHLGDRGLFLSRSKYMLVEFFSKPLNENMVAMNPEK